MMIDESSTTSALQQFEAILTNKQLTMHYQPIVSLTTGQTFGFESLTRGPKHSSFFYPLDLFAFAEQHHSLYELEKLARECAIEQAHDRIYNENIFINLSAQVIHDPHFTPGQTLQVLQRFGLTPQQIVFEITERSAITDFEAFRKALNHYRDQGFSIAIDDAGAGYSSLQAISELMPDFIKVDRSLIENIHNIEVKEHILEAFVRFAKKMNIKVIAEGIETLEELQKVMELGIEYGQGFLFGRPSADMLQPDIAAIEAIFKRDMPQRRGIVVSVNDTIYLEKNGEIIKIVKAKTLCDATVMTP